MLDVTLVTVVCAVTVELVLPTRVIEVEMEVGSEMELENNTVLVVVTGGRDTVVLLKPMICVVEDKGGAEADGLVELEEAGGGTLPVVLGETAGVVELVKTVVVAVVVAGGAIDEDRVEDPARLFVVDAETVTLESTTDVETCVETEV